jgi:hypothetical protein
LRSPHLSSASLLSLIFLLCLLFPFPAGFVLDRWHHRCHIGEVSLLSPSSPLSAGVWSLCAWVLGPPRRSLDCAPMPCCLLACIFAFLALRNPID